MPKYFEVEISLPLVKRHFPGWFGRGDRRGFERRKLQGLKERFQAERLPVHRVPHQIGEG
jgi:hypothetical protein